MDAQIKKLEENFVEAFCPYRAGVGLESPLRSDGAAEGGCDLCSSAAPSLRLTNFSADKKLQAESFREWSKLG
jgi:hypothetical protein